MSFAFQGFKSRWRAPTCEVGIQRGMADAGFGGVFGGEVVHFFSHVLLSSKLGESAWEKETGQVSQKTTRNFQALNPAQ